MPTQVDEIPVTRKQKLKFYRLGICPRLSWDLTIFDFPVSWIEKTLDAVTTRFLKKWAGFAKSADPARLFLPQNLGGLNLSLPSTLYQKLQVGKASLLITSLDGGVNHAVRESLKKETNQKQAKLHPYTVAQEAFASDPGTPCKVVSRKAKRVVVSNVNSKRLEHSLSLPTQGKLFKLVDTNAATIWAKACQSLPSA